MNLEAEKISNDGRIVTALDILLAGIKGPNGANKNAILLHEQHHCLRLIENRRPSFSFSCCLLCVHFPAVWQLCMERLIFSKAAINRAIKSLLIGRARVFRSSDTTLRESAT